VEVMGRIGDDGEEGRLEKEEGRGIGEYKR